MLGPPRLADPSRRFSIEPSGRGTIPRLFLACLLEAPCKVPVIAPTSNAQLAPGSTISSSTYFLLSIFKFLLFIAELASSISEHKAPPPTPHQKRTFQKIFQGHRLFQDDGSPERNVTLLVSHNFPATTRGGYLSIVTGIAAHR